LFSSIPDLKTLFKPIYEVTKEDIDMILRPYNKKIVKLKEERAIHDKESIRH